jgi:hypothetical protein
LRKYPEDNPRRKHVEEDLKKDLEYVEENMKENPVVIKHREKMRLMHQDFFKLLKWSKKQHNPFSLLHYKMRESESDERG